MAQRQVRDLDEAVLVLVGADIEIYITGPPQIVAFRETRIGHDIAVAATRDLYRFQNVRGASGTRDRDQEIARTEIMQASASFAFRASNAGVWAPRGSAVEVVRLP